MKYESQAQRPWWVPIASIIMALLVMATSLMAPQMLSFAKYVSEESAGVVTLSLTHAHSILTDGYKLRHALIKGSTNGAPTHTSGIASAGGVTEVYFGTPAEYESQIKDIPSVDVSAAGDGSILLYKNDTKAYIVSNRTIATGSNFGSTFEGITSLSKVHFSSDFDTSRATTFEYLFYGCSSLSSIENLNKFNTSRCQSMQSMFYTGSSALKSVDTSSFNTSNVEDMGSMFRNCSGISGLDLSNFNTSKVKDMGGMFSGCSGLKSLNVTSFNTSKVETMQLMFSGLTMTSLDLRSFRCDSLNQADQMFSNCTSLKSIYADYAFDLRDLTPEKEGSFNNMFLNCGALTGGSGTKYSTNASSTDETVKKNAANNTYAVVDVNLVQEQDIFKSSAGYFTHYSGADEGSAFLKVGKELNIALKKLSGTSGASYDTSNTNIQHIKIGKPSDYNVNVSGMSSVNVANDGSDKIKAYWDSANKTIYILSNSTICFNTTSDYIFQNFAGVQDFEFKSFSTSAVKTMQRFFEGCKALTRISVSGKFETHNVADFGGFMRYCSSLPNSVITDFVSTLDTSSALDLGGFFATCTSLTGHIDLTNFNTSSNLTYASMFSDCSNITSVNISSFTTGATMNTISTMFSGCTKLQTIQTNSNFDLSKFTYTGSTGDSVFTGCNALRGGNGTTFANAKVTNKSYARPDAPGTPGYFTVINAQTLALRAVAFMMMAPVVSDSDLVASDSDMISDSDVTETPVSDGDITSESTTVVTSESDITVTSDLSTTTQTTVTTTVTTTATTTTTTTTTVSTSATTTTTTSTESQSTTATTVPVSDSDTTTTASSTTASSETAATTSSTSESSESTSTTVASTESTSSETSSDETTTTAESTAATTTTAATLDASNSDATTVIAAAPTTTAKTAAKTTPKVSTTYVTTTTTAAEATTVNTTVKTTTTVVTTTTTAASTSEE